MSLLTLIHDAADRIGIPRPSTVIGSSDHQVRHLLSLANQIGLALLRRHDWASVVDEHTFTGFATNTLPADFERIVPRTFWNRSSNRRVAGPLTPQKWQEIQSGPVVSAWDAYRIQGNTLYLTPTPSGSPTFAFEYVKKYWCMSDGDTTADQAAFVADTDTTIWTDEVIALGVIWRFKKARGLEYGEDFRDYESEVARLISNDGGISDIQMVDTAIDPVSDPHVTEGSWSLS